MAPVHIMREMEPLRLHWLYAACALRVYTIFSPHLTAWAHRLLKHTGTQTVSD